MATDNKLAALSSSAGPAVEADRLGEMIYRALYEHKGGLWGAVDDFYKETVWNAAGRRLAATLYAHPAPATVEMREALKDCAQWLDVILAEKVVVEPENERHIAASVARARAALAPATEGRKS